MSEKLGNLSTLELTAIVSTSPIVTQTNPPWWLILPSRAILWQIYWSWPLTNAEGGYHLEEDQREQMDKNFEDLLAVGDEFKNWRSLVHLLDSPFQQNKALPIINNGTNLSNYVNEDPINIIHKCSVVICMQTCIWWRPLGWNVRRLCKYQHLCWLHTRE